MPALLDLRERAVLKLSLCVTVFPQVSTPILCVTNFCKGSDQPVWAFTASRNCNYHDQSTKINLVLGYGNSFRVT
jgi:hypothetical protein